ncbi:MAG TPA: NADH-quinone oxidoreductase subunit A [Terriglobales bacterium]|jgi:NADH-quinone oxidoreductase subunit A
MILWPLVVYFILVVALVGAMLALSAVLGERHQQPATNLPYEGGIASTGSAHLRMPARFYLIAMFFVIFDLESAFIFSWAVVAREAGWSGYIEICGFIGVLLLTLFYLAKVGALDWGEAKPGGQRSQRSTGMGLAGPVPARARAGGETLPALLQRGEEAGSPR